MELPASNSAAITCRKLKQYDLIVPRNTSPSYGRKNNKKAVWISKRKNNNICRTTSSISAENKREEGAAVDFYNNNRQRNKKAWVHFVGIGGCGLSALAMLALKQVNSYFISFSKTLINIFFSVEPTLIIACLLD